MINPTCACGGRGAIEMKPLRGFFVLRHLCIGVVGGFPSGISTPMLGTFSARGRGAVGIRRCCAPAVTQKLGIFDALSTVCMVHLPSPQSAWFAPHPQSERSEAAHPHSALKASLIILNS